MVALCYNKRSLQFLREAGLRGEMRVAPRLTVFGQDLALGRNDELFPIFVGLLAHIQEFKRVEV